MRKAKKPLSKKDLRKIADNILDKEMYYKKGHHQYIRKTQLDAYTLIYGMDIEFIISRGIFGFGKQTVKKVLLSRPVRSGTIQEVWVYFPPERRTPTAIRSIPTNEEEEEY